MSFADFLSVCPQNLSRLRLYQIFTTITSKANTMIKVPDKEFTYKGIHVISRPCLSYKRDIWNIIVNVKCDSKPARLPGGIFVSDVILPKGFFIWDVIVTLPKGFFIGDVMSAKSAAKSCEKFFFKDSFWKCEKMISPQQINMLWGPYCELYWIPRLSCRSWKSILQNNPLELWYLKRTQTNDLWQALLIELV